MYSERKADRAVDTGLKRDTKPASWRIYNGMLTVSTEADSSSGSNLASITQTP